LGDLNYVKKGYSGNASAPLAPASVPQGSFGPDPNAPAPVATPPAGDPAISSETGE